MKKERLNKYFKFNKSDRHMKKQIESIKKLFSFTKNKKSPVARSPVVMSPVVKSPVVKSPVARSPVVRSPVARSPVSFNITRVNSLYSNSGNGKELYNNPFSDFILDEAPKAKSNTNSVLFSDNEDSTFDKIDTEQILLFNNNQEPIKTMFFSETDSLQTEEDSANEKYWNSSTIINWMENDISSESSTNNNISYMKLKFFTKLLKVNNDDYEITIE